MLAQAIHLILSALWQISLIKSVWFCGHSEGGKMSCDIENGGFFILDNFFRLSLVNK